MTRALRPDQFEDRATCPCAKGTTKIVRGADGRKHVWRLIPNVSGGATWTEITLASLPPEWDETPFDALSLPAAAGGRHEGLAEGLRLAGFGTVGELIAGWRKNDWRLGEKATRIYGHPDSRPMHASRDQIRKLLRHLERRRVECETWRKAQT